MSLTLVQSGGVTSTSNTTGFTVTLSQATAAGNLLAIYQGARLVAASTTSSTVDSASNTLTTFSATGSTSGAAAWAAIAYEINCPAGITSVTVTFSGNCTAAFWFEEWSGVSTGAIDSSASAVTSGTSSSTAISSGGVTTSNANDLLLSSLAFLGAISIGTFTGGFTTDTLQQSTSGTGSGNCQGGNLAVSSTGTYTFAATLSQAEKNAGVVVAFQAAGGTLYTKSLSGALSFTGSLARSTLHALTGALSFVGSQSRKVGHGLTAGLVFTGTQSRAIQHGLAAAALKFTGSFSASKLYHSTLSGALSFTGSLASLKLRQQAFTAALSFTGNQRRAISHGLTGALSFTGSVGRAIHTGLASALDFVGTFLATPHTTVVTYYMSTPPNWQPWMVAASWQVVSWDTELYNGGGTGYPPPVNTTILVANVQAPGYSLKVWIPASQVTPLG